MGGELQVIGFEPQAVLNTVSSNYKLLTSFNSCLYKIYSDLENIYFEFKSYY